VRGNPSPRDLLGMILGGGQAMGVDLAVTFEVYDI